MKVAGQRCALPQALKRATTMPLATACRWNMRSVENTRFGSLPAAATAGLSERCCILEQPARARL